MSQNLKGRRKKIVGWYNQNMVRVRGAERIARNIRITTMLQEGIPVDLIEVETGASRATIFRRKAMLRGDEIPATAEAGKETTPAGPVDVGGPVAVATLAYLAGVSVLGIAAAYGLDHYDLDADALDFGLAGKDVSRRRLERLSAKADALERMRRNRPAQWAAWVAQQDDGERKAALDSRLPRETWTGFFGEIVAHQSGLLIERDFRDWIEWVEDLTVARYPSMKD